MKFRVNLLFSFFFIFLICQEGYAQSMPPTAAMTAGLAKVIFEEQFDDSSKIDLQNTKKEGFNFYLSRPFGWPSTTPESLTFDNGILTIKSPVNKAQFDIASAAPLANGKWVGFAQNGLAYFEASISFDPEDIHTVQAKEGFPAFWTMSAEHLFGKYQKAKINYEYLEIDFMEWNPKWHPFNTYIQSIHYWINFNGKNKSSAIGKGKIIKPSEPVNWKNFNTFGLLWIPGKRIDAYFNNKLLRSVSVSDYPAIMVGNNHHFPVILGSGKFPMRVDWVRVWGK